MTDPVDLNEHLAALDKITGLVWPPVTPPVPPGGDPSTTPVNLQALINNAAAGSTLHVPGGTYKGRVSVTKNLNIVFDAPFLLDGTGAGVPLSNGAFTIQNASVNISGAMLRISGSFGAGLDFINAHDCVCSNLDLVNNAQQGYHAYRAVRCTMKNCHVHLNNTNYANNIDNEAGAGKLWDCGTFVFDGCEIDHNGGHGIWFDSGSAGNTNCVVQNCRIHHNGRAGILFEICGGPNKALNNTVWENGWHKLGDRGWCGGIVSSTSRGSEIAGNLLAWNQEGVIVGGQPRSDFPATVINNYCHDNVVAMWPQSPTNTRYGLDWYGPGGDAMFQSAANNRGLNNKFWWQNDGASGYSWNGGSLSLTQFAATPGGAGSQLTSLADIQARLVAAGVPLTAETH